MNPFLNNHQEEEGSFMERFHVRHALSSRKAATPDVDAEWERLKARIGEREASGSNEAENDGKEARKSRGARHIRLWMTAAAIFAVVLVTAGIVWLTPSSSIADGDGVVLYIAEAPSWGCVTVTTSGGVRKEIAPESSRSTRHVIETEAAPDEFVIVETPVGQEITVVLPDSSTVWLWPGSSLQYPARFDASQRVVTLRGEAYFDVTSSEQSPFIVHTDYFNTRVYGTEFVIRAMGKQESGVLLLEGSVGVSTEYGKESIRLNPGQEASLSPDNGDEVIVSEFDTYPLQQWRDGMFFFEDDRLIDILKVIGRWYGISVVAYDEDVLQRRLHFVTDRTDNPADVVAALALLIPSSVLEYSSHQITVR